MSPIELFHAFCKRAAYETDAEILSEIRERMIELLLNTHTEFPETHKPNRRPN